MKLNNGRNIISVDDVSTNNIPLSLILLKQQESIESLKGDVKWLYKYGGVGGGGGSSSGGLKISPVIEYTNTNNLKVSEKLINGKRYNISKNTIVKVIVTITSTKLLNEYKFTIGNYQTTIKATDVNGVISLAPNENSLYTLTVVGESTVSMDFTIYTDSMLSSAILRLANGSIVNNNSPFYSSLLEGAQFIVNLFNYQMDYFNDDTIDNIIINGLSVPFTVEKEEDLSKNTRRSLVTIPLENYVLEFGIYNIEVSYTFNKVINYIRNTYIFKDANQYFINCYSNSGLQIYKNTLELNPVYSNNRFETINFVVYGTIHNNPADIIQVKITDIINELELVLDVKNSSLGYTFSILNTTTEGSKWYPIKFEILNSDFSETYYVNFVTPPEVSYIFKNRVGEYYYNAVLANTDYPNLEVIDFPKYDNSAAAYVINKEESYTVKSVSKRSGYANTDINTYVLNIEKGDDYGEQIPFVDGLLSLGIKFSDYNYTKPIISIDDKIILYKNKLSYKQGGVETIISDRFTIPKDDKYHLVLLYIKSNYTIDSSLHDYKTGENNSAVQSLILCIDGVMETSPLNIPDFYISIGTKITYYPGKWQFNHLGFATFNCRPRMTYVYTESGDQTEEVNGVPSVVKYYYDYDPVIPANYYQAYSQLEYTFDAGIYNVLSLNNNQGLEVIYNWVNFYNGLNKFIKVESIESIAKLTDLPIYCVDPENKGNSTLFNEFLENTLTSYGENDVLPEAECKFMQWKENKFIPLIPELIFKILYQGSSTLLFGAKNFEISTIPRVDEQGNSLDTYFTPDKNKFKYLEKSFNLKADIVDSSHSNNVVIGNFVNDYMESPFKTVYDNYRSCLSGYPCLLFMKNNVDGSDNSHYIYLGIYNIALNRSSTNNLGYTKLITSEEYLDNIDLPNVQYYNMKVTDEVLLNGNFRVAEVQGNSPIYDYSLFDLGLLQDMFGDYFYNNNGVLDRTFTNDFKAPFKELASYINSIFKLLSSDRIFNIYDIPNKNRDPKYNGCYYLNENGDYVAILDIENSESFILDYDLVNSLLSYKSYLENTTGKKISAITNPNYQFHILYSSPGVKYNITTPYYYVEKVELSYNSEESTLHNYFNIENVIKYYMVCMAFAMADSVQKNLTVRCPNYNINRNNTWFIGFYDMDTAFGLSNSGGQINFTAFSDFVDSEGNIIQDYVEPGTEGWFDSPSSYLFLFAKYAGLLDNTFAGTDGKNYPFLYWIDLRTNQFKSGTYFCENYINNYFGKINPLLWNLNYMYKYFSATKNDTSDTELSRFNGTMRYRREEWLNERFKYLDVMFGIKNTLTIGNSSVLINGGFTNVISNSDITIQETMFPSFKKGMIMNTINVDVEGSPRTPVVLQTSTNRYTLYLLNLEGKTKINKLENTDTDIGFFGTTKLTALSESGLFLGNKSSTNTILNNYLKDIVLNNVPKNNQTIEINLNLLQSVETITLRNGTFNSLTIRGDKHKLNLITISNSKLNTLNFVGIEVLNIIIERSELGNVTFSGVTCETIKYSGNKIKAISIDNTEFSNKKIEITDSVCTSFTCTGGTYDLVKLNCPTLTNLSLKNTRIDEISIISSISWLKNILVTNVYCEVFHLGNVKATSSNSVSSFNTIIETLDLGFNNEDIHFSIPGFYKLNTISFGNVKTVYLDNNAFAFCSELPTLPKNITYYINGSGIFYDCGNLDKNSLINPIINTTDISYIFGARDNINSNIDLKFVVDWFEKNKGNTGITNVSGMFCGISTIETILIDNLYNNFVKHFSEFVGGRTVDTSYMFYRTKFNILTTALSNKIGENYTCFLGENGGVSYIENGSLTSKKTITGSGIVINGQWEWHLFKVFEGNALITNPAVSDVFGEGLTTINQFTIYTNKDSYFDFEEGLPSTVTNINRLFYPDAYCNFKNLENCFKKSNPRVLQSFRMTRNLEHPASSINISENYTDLFQFMFTENEEGISLKATIILPQLTSDRDYIIAENTGFTFPKYISAENFNKVITFFSELTQQINYLFSNCVVLNGNSDLLKDKLSNFTSLLGTFYNFKVFTEKNEVAYLDLNGAFGDNSYYKAISNLRQAFYKNNLKQITGKFPITSCLDMVQTFYDCQWSYDNANEIYYDPLKVDNVPSIIVIADNYLKYPVIPEGFFEITTQTSDLTQCFASSKESVYNLWGYIPKEDYWGITTSNTKDLILNANVFYTLKNVVNDRKLFTVFPVWYQNKSWENRFLVLIPFSPENSTVFIFDDGKVNINKYGCLPTYYSQTSSTYYDKLLFSSENKSIYEENKSSIKAIYNEDDDKRDFIKPMTFNKEIISKKLAYLLDSTSTIISGIDQVDSDLVKPIIKQDVYDNIDTATNPLLFNGEGIESKTVKNLLF